MPLVQARGFTKRTVSALQMLQVNFTWKNNFIETQPTPLSSGSGIGTASRRFWQLAGEVEYAPAVCGEATCCGCLGGKPIASPLQRQAAPANQACDSTLDRPQMVYMHKPLEGSDIPGSSWACHQQAGAATRSESGMLDDAE